MPLSPASKLSTALFHSTVIFGLPKQSFLQDLLGPQAVAAVDQGNVRRNGW